MNPHDQAYQDQVDADGHDLYVRERDDRLLDFAPGVRFPPAARGGHTGDEPPSRREIVMFVAVIAAVYSFVVFAAVEVFS